jgi:FAD/FMN-containing dehydrogenase
MSSSLWSTKLTRDTNCTRTLIVDGTKYLTKMKMVGNNLVTVETGVKIERLLEYLDEHGVALPIAPIPGQKKLTVGESVSIGAYSIGVNSFKEKPLPFSTVSR